MADDKHYVPGDFYRIDDRTGFKVRASRTRKEWTGNIVAAERWERRQPQDFVTGVRDDQSVLDPRPRQPDQFVRLSTGAEFMVYGDLPSGISFLVQNASGPSANFGNVDNTFRNSGGTAAIQVFNGTFPPVTVASL